MIEHLKYCDIENGPAETLVYQWKFHFSAFFKLKGIFFGKKMTFIITESMKRQHMEFVVSVAGFVFEYLS